METGQCDIFFLRKWNKLLGIRRGGGWGKEAAPSIAQNWPQTGFLIALPIGFAINWRKFGEIFNQGMDKYWDQNKQLRRTWQFLIGYFKGELWDSQVGNYCLWLYIMKITIRLSLASFTPTVQWQMLKRNPCIVYINNWIKNMQSDWIIRWPSFIAKQLKSKKYQAAKWSYFIAPPNFTVLTSQ